jgi:hypothetical protein
MRHAIFAASLQETAVTEGIAVDVVTQNIGLIFGLLGGQMPLKSGVIDVSALNLEDGTTEISYAGFDTFVENAKTVASYVNGGDLTEMIGGFDALVTMWNEEPEIPDTSICLVTDDPELDRSECRNVTTVAESTDYNASDFNAAIAVMDVAGAYYDQAADAEREEVTNPDNRNLGWLYVDETAQTNTAYMMKGVLELLNIGAQGAQCVPLVNYNFACDITPSEDFAGLAISLSSCSKDSDTCRLSISGTVQGQTFSVTSTAIPDIRYMLGGKASFFYGNGFTAGPMNMCFSGSISNTTARVQLSNFCIVLDVSSSPSSVMSTFANMILTDFNDPEILDPALAALIAKVYLKVGVQGNLSIVSTDASIGSYTLNNMNSSFAFDREVANGNKTGPMFIIRTDTLNRTNPMGETSDHISGAPLFMLEINNNSYLTSANIEEAIGLPPIKTVSSVDVAGLDPIIPVLQEQILSLIDSNTSVTERTAEEWQALQAELEQSLEFSGTNVITIYDESGTTPEHEYTMLLSDDGYVDVSSDFGGQEPANMAMRLYLSGVAGYVYSGDTLVSTAHLGNSQDGLLLSRVDGVQKSYTNANPDPLGGLQGFLDFLQVLVPPTEETAE